jgi:hypothetical protein
MTAICKTCAYADQHGWWGPDHAGTHCRGCHRSWTSTAQAHCTICHATFTANGPAELHWPRGRHADPAIIDELHRGPDDVWSTSADRDPAAIRRAFVERVHPGRAA